MNYISLKCSLVSMLLFGGALSASADNDNHYWTEFTQNPSKSQLLDFSYAGYKRGEAVPPTVEELKAQGYKVYNVTQYGAIPDDAISDRQALIDIAKLIGRGKAKANAIIYFPKGRYILHDEHDNTPQKSSSPVELLMGNVVLQGDGIDQTILEMASPNYPKNQSQMYSSPVMLSIANNGEANPPLLGNITQDSPKGSFSLTLDDASMVKPKQWVWLKVKNNTPAVINEELQGLPLVNTMTDIIKNGVQVDEYHQVKAVNGNVVTFYEPIMHEVKSSWGWTLHNYKHYENVGIEDLTFIGHAVPDFVHHRSWMDDGGYKPLNLKRLVNSWVRRVKFTSVSEALTFSLCANVSAYDIVIDGNRGHSSVRAEGCTRAFIGNVDDHAAGYYVKKIYDQRYENLGQYHACGVSKHSIGNVIWNCKWGLDACFESHATQPRATLIDACTGGFMQLRMGGDYTQLPNHLDDLIIWNFESLPTASEDFGTFTWWEKGTQRWTKVMPPLMVGFHGALPNLRSDQMKANDSFGTKVTPESLYLAQLEKRVGAQSPWFQILKAITGVKIPTQTTSEKNKKKGVFTLTGEKIDVPLSQMPKGIYIVNGQKVYQRQP